MGPVVSSQWGDELVHHWPIRGQKYVPAIVSMLMLRLSAGTDCARTDVHFYKLPPWCCNPIWSNVLSNVHAYRSKSRIKWRHNDSLETLEVCYKVISCHKSTDIQAPVCFIPDYFHSTPNCVHLSWSFEAGSAPGTTDGQIIHTRPPAFSHSVATVALLLMESYYEFLRTLSG